MEDCLLIRCSELYLKSKRSRPGFRKRMYKAIEVAFERHGVGEYSISNEQNMYVLVAKNIEKAAMVMEKIAGVHSFSQGRRFVFKEKKDLVETLHTYGKDLVKEKLFRVKVTKRVGEHAFRSQEVAVELGAALQPHSAGVNLSNPDITFFLDIRNQQCTVFTDTVMGMGGMAQGTKNMTLSLFSGGIDSPIAAYEMMKRGCPLDYLFINLVGEKNLNDMGKVYNYLIDNYVYNYEPKLYIADGVELVKFIEDNVADVERQIALKVYMYQFAEMVAKKEGHFALCTGEAMSQKSTQTFESLLCIDQATSMTVFRPLLTYDKNDVLAQARKIGTLHLSENVTEYCSLSKGQVETRPRLNLFQTFPNCTPILQRMVDSLFVCHGQYPIEDVKDAKSVFKEEGIITVDMRFAHRQEEVPMEMDVSFPYPEILKKLECFEEGKTYLFVCEYGIRSKELAYSLRKKGISAASMTEGMYRKHVEKG